MLDNDNTNIENSVAETLYLSSFSKTREDIIDGLKTPIEDCLKESEVEW